MVKKILLSVTLAIVSSAYSRAEVHPAGLFGNGVVLQQKKPVPVWGTARDGEKVTVNFQGHEISTVAHDGQWRVTLPPLDAGGPFTLVIHGDNTIVCTNVLVGEVWLCSGQSNMAFKLYRAATAAAAIAASTDNQLRFFQVFHEAADEPRTDVTGDWQTSSPVTSSNFSAVAYFFGRDLRKALGVPVGLIDTSVGGTPIRAWISRPALAADPKLQTVLTDYETSVKEFDPAKAEAEFADAQKEFALKKSRAEAEGRPAPTPPRKGVNPARRSNRPACLYNGLIAPLVPYALAGVIWYQGEADSSRGAQYQILFPTLIRSWRAAWAEGDFPFLFVQVAPYHETKPEIREAQMLTVKRVPFTAMAVTADVGENLNIHPLQKEPVGDRLALAARVLAYGEKIEYIGPAYASMNVVSNSAVLNFSHADGLAAHGDKVRGFTIAGADGIFFPAEALIESNTVAVHAPEVSQPVAVRYGWANTPNVNLFNSAGLPASPFRTDVPQ